MALSLPCTSGLMEPPCPKRLFGLWPFTATSDPATDGLFRAPGRHDLDATPRSLAVARGLVLSSTIYALDIFTPTRQDTRSAFSSRERSEQRRKPDIPSMPRISVGL